LADAEFENNKRDVEGTYLKTLELAPEFAERVRSARREAPFRGEPGPNFFRKPYGPGWALVGDAGYIKDPVTAWGISDAFRDAELCTTALAASFLGTRPFDEAMSDYQKQRDAHPCRVRALLELPLPTCSCCSGRGRKPGSAGSIREHDGGHAPARRFRAGERRADHGRRRQQSARCGFNTTLMHSSLNGRRLGPLDRIAGSSIRTGWTVRDAERLFPFATHHLFLVLIISARRRPPPD
jgi:hypothetical protein